MAGLGVCGGAGLLLKLGLMAPKMERRRLNLASINLSMVLLVRESGGSIMSSDRFSLLPWDKLLLKM